jgi:hypothetical protein
MRRKKSKHQEHLIILNIYELQDKIDKSIATVGDFGVLPTVIIRKSLRI